jgi:hypothetical protein
MKDQGCGLVCSALLIELIIGILTNQSFPRPRVNILKYGVYVKYQLFYHSRCLHLAHTMYIYVFCIIHTINSEDCLPNNRCLVLIMETCCLLYSGNECLYVRLNSAICGGPGLIPTSSYEIFSGQNGTWTFL